MRACGVLLPVASLPSEYGIGSFSKSAYEFVDTLKAAGQKYWQILPLGPTSYGDSPYQSFSAFAGNPYFIDLDELIREGLLTKEEVGACDFGDDPRYIDYKKIYNERFKLLQQAFFRSKAGNNDGFQKFMSENREWLEDYCLYMAAKRKFGGASWSEWDEDIRNREPEALARYREMYSSEMRFYAYMQYLFRKQWMRLKEYANQNGILIIGDIPIYVAFDSADTWAAPEMFQFDENRRPVAVAGCPPDGFSATGQLWGNPLYDWDYHRQTGYSWWVKRMRHSFSLYDTVRVDHFRGFDEYYSIPYGDQTAEFGCWKRGPGIELFEVLKRELGDRPIIAEDLGYLTPSVIKLVKDSGYPGMKVLEFAFDSREESDYLPHNYTKNCVVYTGTHDNQTLKAWFYELSEEDRKLAMDYVNLYGRDEEAYNWEFIRLAMGSVANLAVIPIQDYLGLGAEARINRPSTLGGNWSWRLLKGEITEELIRKMRKLAKVYGRL